MVPDSPHKIFIGGLPNYLNEDQVCLLNYSNFIIPELVQRKHTGDIFDLLVVLHLEIC